MKQDRGYFLAVWAGTAARGLHLPGLSNRTDLFTLIYYGEAGACEIVGFLAGNQDFCHISV